MAIWNYEFPSLGSAFTPLLFQFFWDRALWVMSEKTDLRILATMKSSFVEKHSYGVSLLSLGLLKGNL